MRFSVISILAIAALTEAAPKPNKVVDVAAAMITRPPLRAGAAYEDIADAIGAANKRKVENIVATRPPLRAGAAYEDIADALGSK